MNDFGVFSDSLGEAKKIFRAITAISASDYLVKQELAALRVRIELERDQVFNRSGKAASSITHFRKLFTSVVVVPKTTLSYPQWSVTLRTSSMDFLKKRNL